MPDLRRICHLKLEAEASQGFAENIKEVDIFGSQGKTVPGLQRLCTPELDPPSRALESFEAAALVRGVLVETEQSSAGHCEHELAVRLAHSLGGRQHIPSDRGFCCHRSCGI